MPSSILVDSLNSLDSKRDFVVDTLSRLIEIKALSPENGGNGEWDKAEYVEGLLDFADDVRRYDAEDERAKNGLRPNIVAKIKGKSSRTLWIVTHLDVVPEGDLSLWESDPFKARVEGDRIYGRGAEDNGQAIVSTLLAGMFLAENEPDLSFGMVFVSDEETGSDYGIQHLIKKGIFGKNDLFVVPDAGSPDGSLIEVAEKTILWIRFEIFGKQGHASRPDTSFNASRRAMKMLLELDEILHRRYDYRNELFEPPFSTFEPTRREKNVDNVNTIPGLDVSYMDCRILPDYDVDEVIEFLENFLERKRNEDGYDCRMEVVQKSWSPPTDEDAEIVLKLKKAIMDVRGIKARAIGVGGNTCASFFRRAGFETAVWNTSDETAHQPNEYARISNIIEDAKVFAYLAFER
ncbi:M20 family metallo-hydrolase [Geoglobus acetivorans]|uniref:M20 family metallo-hydrolase n=1 Tax=Geoglobus acetivorans TaxID=565033 RepID=A0ABZ3H1V2_GEOAI|nr:M20 family metallo-hydrolase [Geoglobus acetivorans]